MMLPLDDPAVAQPKRFTDPLFGIAWRLSLFLLPLQTRWFAPAMLAGWPWEQGQWSFYASWIPMIAAVVIGFFLPKKTLPVWLGRNILFFVAALAAVTVAADPVSVAASAQWWIQMILLASFFMTLIRADVPVFSVAGWFVLSLIPHALFAVFQVHLQYVPGWSWIGVAAQMTGDLGVSVVQTETMRWLRAYGGLPHPNIFGGWMAMGMLAAAWLAGQPRSESHRRDAPMAHFYRMIPLFAVGLYYSFSRSAWLGFAAGAVILTAYEFSHAPAKSKQIPAGQPYPSGRLFGRTLFAMGLSGFVFLFFAFLHSDLTASRLGLSSIPRLETRSFDARAESLQNGIRVFQAYPLFGTGPNAELPALACLMQGSAGACDLQTLQPTAAPFEPPHHFWVLIFTNTGVAGSLIIFGFLLFLLRRLLVRWKAGDPPFGSLVYASAGLLFTLSFFDHYLWSLWSGQAILLFCCYLCLSWLITASPPKSS